MIDQTQRKIRDELNDGNSEDLAYYRTLPDSYFAQNVTLYFKLIDKNHSEDYISLLAAVTADSQKPPVSSENFKEKIKNLEEEITQLKTKLASIKSNCKNFEAKLKEKSAVVERLNDKCAEILPLQTAVRTAEANAETLKIKLQTKNDLSKEYETQLTTIKSDRDQLEAQLATLKTDRDLLHTQLEDELKKQRSITLVNQQEARKTKAPIDIDDFLENLEGNFINVGLRSSAEYYALLLIQLRHILFQGMPVVINKASGLVLMKCLTNTISGHQNPHLLSYKSDVTINDVDFFLFSDERIVCLDNFIGNFNELELIPLFYNHKDKIIFLTLAYEGTLRYISKEFWLYAHYLNVNRIVSFFSCPELEQRPSLIEESSFEPPKTIAKTRYSNLLGDILDELGFPKNVNSQRCAETTDEQSLCAALAFEILPYCTDVLRLSPYNVSERFLQYAGAAGRCPSKNLFWEWFKP
jgi:ABC-type phosphate transport system auxiliary subunit